MSEKFFDSLSDMSKIKDNLMYLFYNSRDIVGLIMPKSNDEAITSELNWYGRHCFDTPYIEGIISDNSCAVFIETYLTKVENQHIKEVGIDIIVVCHKDSIMLSEEEKKYFNSIGVYGNRIDSAIQLINSAILNQSTMDMIKENYSIGNMVLSKENPLKQYDAGTNFYGKCLSYTYQTFYRRKNTAR